MAPAWGDPFRAPWQLVVRKGRLLGLLTVQALGPSIGNAKPSLVSASRAAADRHRQRSTCLVGHTDPVWPRADPRTRFDTLGRFAVSLIRISPWLHPKPQRR